jgi:hypothetical protein
MDRADAVGRNESAANESIDVLNEAVLTGHGVA